MLNRSSIKGSHLARLWRLLLIMFCLSCGPTATNPKVLFIGIDGATWKVISALMRSGQLPAFQRLTEEGAYMPEFETMDTTKSPIVWTSVATGRLGEAHGVAGYTEHLGSGKVIPVTSNARKVKAIWNIATDFGMSVGVINWWASWPAEEVNGYIVTDHANPAAVGWMTHDYYWKAAPEILRRLQRDFSPADLVSILRSHWLDKENFPFDELQRRSGLTLAQIDQLKKAPWDTRTYYSWLKTFFAVDYAHFTLARELAQIRPTDLQMLYLRGPDPVQHYAWHLVEPEAFPEPVGNLERDSGIVEGVYRYVDSFLQEILESKFDDTILIVASDHGAEPVPPTTYQPGRKSGGHSTAAKGVLFLHGSGVKSQYILKHGNPLDLMPTMAWLLGIPVADDLAGSVLTDAFEDAFVDRKEVTSVASYGGRENRPGLASQADEVLMEQLESLGYIE